MLVKILLWLLSLLPLSWLQVLGAGLGRLVYRFDERYRKRLQINAQYAGYDTPEFFRSVAANMGRSVTELAHVWTSRVNKLLPLVKAKGWEEVLQAKAQGKGVLMLTPHIGAFELLCLWIGQRESLTAMYRPPKQAAIAGVMLAGRKKFNVNMASADMKGLRTMLRALNKGELVGLLPDQVPSNEADGVIANMFGQPALTMTLPSKLLRKTDAALVVMYARRVDAPHRFEVEFKVVDFELSGDAADDALRINALMEEIIRKVPEQYLWAYNRYKRLDKIKLELSNKKSPNPNNTLNNI